MPKTVTLRLSDRDYELFRSVAAADNRAISNLIETAAKQHLVEASLMSAAEEREILSDAKLMKSIQSGRKQQDKRRGRFVA